MSRNAWPTLAAADHMRDKFGESAVSLASSMNWIHISDDDLERYYLSMVTTEEEVAPLGEHMLACPSCAKRAEAARDYVDAMRVALLRISD